MSVSRLARCLRYGTGNWMGNTIRYDGARKGTDTMASWLMIIFAYVIIAVGVFNLFGPGSHLLY